MTVSGWIILVAFMAIGAFVGDAIRMSASAGMYIFAALSGLLLGIAASFGGQ